MSAIPLHDLDEVATKGDLRAGLAEIQAALAEVQAKLETGLAESKSDRAELRAELDTKLAEHRAEFKSDLTALQRTMVYWSMTMIAAVIGVGFLA